jgi:hypothetical protein
MMIWRSIVVTLVLCIAMLFIIFFVATEKPKSFDCRLAEYPTAIDVPQAVIKACREAKIK